MSELGIVQCNRCEAPHMAVSTKKHGRGGRVKLKNCVGGKDRTITHKEFTRLKRASDMTVRTSSDESLVPTQRPCRRNPHDRSFAGNSRRS